MSAAEQIGPDETDRFLAALPLEKFRDTRPAGASWAVRKNAFDAIRVEDWLRSWPTLADTQELDERARQAGRRLSRAPKHIREEAFSTLWWIRFNLEPTIADLVRVGVPFERAEERMDRRLARFERAFRGGG